MNSLKSMITVAILAAVGFGLYLKINSMPDPKPPKDFDSNWVEPPAIDMGGLGDGSSGTPSVSVGESSPAGGGAAPAYDPNAGGGTAPVYVPATGGGGPPPISSTPGLEPSSTGHAEVAASAQMELPGAGGFPRNDYAEQDNYAQDYRGAGASSLPGNTPAASSPTNETTNPFGAHISGGPGNTPDYSSSDYSVNATPGAEYSRQPYDPNAAGQSGQMPTTTATSESLFNKKQHEIFDNAWVDARGMLNNGNLAGAHLLLSAWYNDPSLTDVEQEALQDLLSGLAGTVIYSRENHLEPAYSPAAGETLEQIARRYEVTPELLAKINGITDPDRLNPNQPLKVLRGPFGAMIDPNRQELVLVLQGRYAGRFDIGLGRERLDIEGRYEVKGKATNPRYVGRDLTIEPGDPSNPYGSHFLSLIKPHEAGVAALFGIHGTSQGSGLQSPEARGFVRLSPRDIGDCYDILAEKSPVLIRR